MLQPAGTDSSSRKSSRAIRGPVSPEAPRPTAWAIRSRFSTANDALTMPQLSPQPGQELELPSRTLRNQSGYEQVTVTVTDQNGRYVTGLQKGDFHTVAAGEQHGTVISKEGCTLLLVVDEADYRAA